MAADESEKDRTYADRASLVQRLSLFGLFLLMLFYGVTTSVAAKRADQALNTANKGLGVVSDQLTIVQEQNRQLLNLLKENNITVALGPDTNGDGVPDVVQVQVVPTPTPTPDSGVRSSPPQSSSPKTPAPRPGSKPSTKPSTKPKKPTPSPSPKPGPVPGTEKPGPNDHGIITQKPILGCSNTIVGRICV